MVGGDGTAKFELKENFKNLTTQQHRTITGPLEINVRGEGAPRAEKLEVTFHGENLTEVFACVGCEKAGNPDYSGTNAGFTRTCKFEGVDLVRGGTYKVSADLDDGYGACKIKVPSQ